MRRVSWRTVGQEGAGSPWCVARTLPRPGPQYHL